MLPRGCVLPQTEHSEGPVLAHSRTSESADKLLCPEDIPSAWHTLFYNCTAVRGSSNPVPFPSCSPVTGVKSRIQTVALHVYSCSLLQFPLTNLLHVLSCLGIFLKDSNTCLWISICIHAHVYGSSFAYFL